MAFSDIERDILLDYIKVDSDLYRSLAEIRGAMKNIWSIETPTIIHGFTDHGEAHCVRIAEKVRQILHVNDYKKLTEHEIYLLFAGIYLHDIGMKCDILTHPDIIDIAKQLGANFGDIKFNAPNLVSFTSEEQRVMRANHHYLSAAWIQYASKNEKTRLAHVIKNIHEKLIGDLIDICKFHSQLSLKDCPEKFKVYKTNRKRLVAAILRFADELDIDEDNVSFDTIKYFYVDPVNSVYWWLHHSTVIDFTGENKNLVRINIVLNPHDVDLYGLIIDYICIRNFEKKNREVLNVLAHEGIPLAIDYYSGIEEDEFSPRLPNDVIGEIKNIWLKSSMTTDEIEKTYEGSIYGDRSTHFRQEKAVLAKKVVDYIFTTYLSNPVFSEQKYCFVIDSGTTTYHIFYQICQEMRDPSKKKIWSERTLIVTNNLAGLQHLMINCKEDPSNERSEVALKCLFLPGKPLQPYVAVACEETVKWMSKIEKYLSSEWNIDRSKYEIISIISSSYAVPHGKRNSSDNEGYYPVARETWHINIKKKFIMKSNKVFFIAPLLKFSFARVETLNHLLGFSSNTNILGDVKYTEISIPKEKSVFFTTSRNKNSKFYKFSQSLITELVNLYGQENVVTEEFDVKQYTNNPDIALEMEIPHENLRAKYLEGLNIWDRDYVNSHE